MAGQPSLVSQRNQREIRVEPTGRFIHFFLVTHFRDAHRSVYNLKLLHSFICFSFWSFCFDELFSISTGKQQQH
jgi:hypothetical protein